jgi:hypothetical protein
VTFPFGETATITRRALASTKDIDGNDVYTTTAIPVPGCAFAPAGSVEVVQGRDTVTTTPTLYMPPGTVVLATDAITFRSLLYEVDGTPAVYTNPFTGWNPGVVARLKAVNG